MSPVSKLTIGLSSQLESAPHQFCFPSCVFICSESWLRTPAYRFPCAPSAGRPWTPLATLFEIRGRRSPHATSSSSGTQKSSSNILNSAPRCKSKALSLSPGSKPESAPFGNGRLTAKPGGSYLSVSNPLLDPNQLILGSGWDWHLRIPLKHTKDASQDHKNRPPPALARNLKVLFRLCNSTRDVPQALNPFVVIWWT